jgi:hypothetical protein
MTKYDISSADGLPVGLTAKSERAIESWSLKKLLGLILAALSFGNTAAAGGGAVGVNKNVVLSLDTNIYASGDVLADTQAVTGALASAGEVAILQSLQLTDKDDNTAAGIDLVFLSENVSLGTENSAPSITDTNAAKILGIVSVASGDFIDVGGAKVATKLNIGLQLSAPTGTTVYVAAVTRGTPTQTGSGITLNLGLRQD